MTPKKALPLVLLAAAFAGTIAAQTPPDCSFTFTTTTDATQNGIPNLSNQTPCVNWRITFTATGTRTGTVTFQTSPDNSSFTSVPNTICAANLQPPCLFQGTNPLTGTAQGMSYFSSYGNYVRVTVTGSAGVGNLIVRGYGAKGASASGPAIPGVIIAGAQLVYYQTNTASDIATYLQQTALPFSPKTTLPFAGLANGADTLQNWATNAGVPNLTFIPAGAYLYHTHASRTGAAGTVTLSAQFWEVSALGVDIGQIGQTESSTPLTTIETEYTLAFANGNVYTLASAASRVVARVIARVTAAAGPTVNLFVGGTADSHIALPSNTVDASTFVPYTGATADLNLGSHNLFVAGLPISVNFGSLSVGKAPFDGVSANHFIGNAGGTSIAVNEPVTFTGNLIDLQIAGSKLFSVNISNVLANVPFTSTTAHAGVLTDSTFTSSWIQTGTSQQTKAFQILPTYNQPSATSVANTDLLVNRTQTNLGTTPGAQKLIDLQVATATKFSVDNVGTITTIGGLDNAALCTSAIAGGVRQIGHCTSIVGAGGTCTCVVP